MLVIKTKLLTENVASFQRAIQKEYQTNYYFKVFNRLLWFPCVPLFLSSSRIMLSSYLEFTRLLYYQYCTLVRRLKCSGQSTRQFGFYYFENA